MSADEQAVADFERRRAEKRRGLAMLSPIAAPSLPAVDPIPCAECGKLIEDFVGHRRPVTMVCNACDEANRAWEIRRMAELRNENFAPFCGVPQGYAGMTLETWRSDRVPLPAGIRRWMARPERNLILWGPQGIGKTHLAVACLRWLWDKGQTSLWFCEAPSLNDDLLRDIREGGSKTSDRLQQRRYVLFDDAARLRQSPFVREAFATIVYQRHADRKFEILTTNRDPASLYGQDDVEGPSWSRLMDDAETIGPTDGLSMDDWRLSRGSR